MSVNPEARDPDSDAPHMGKFALRFDEAARRSWATYYRLVLRMHSERGRSLTEPIKDRNLVTTASKHVGVFEKFWRTELASALGVGRDEVGSRKVRFREYRSKSFDVCWPHTGEPRILISVKSMQNAYRNLTNRVEEALGDSAVLRIYDSKAVFGFFFFILDGSVARGRAEIGEASKAKSTGAKPKGIPPFLTLVEDGGDFFDLSEVKRYRRSPSASHRSAKRGGRLGTIDVAQRSLLDLLADRPSVAPDIHYDAMALVPATVRRADDSADDQAWVAAPAAVDERLDHRRFLSRIIEVARLRGLR